MQNSNLSTINHLKLKNGREILIRKGDITLEDTDVIVNAANEMLQHGGGVAGAIVRKGGKIIQQQSDEWIKRYGPVKTGNVAVTDGGNLNCKYVIHAVGPIWRGGNSNEKQLLSSAIINSLKKADELKAGSIAIPAISSGIFGFPKPLCANILLSQTISYLENESIYLSKVHFTNIDDETCQIFNNELENIKSKNNSI